MTCSLSKTPLDMLRGPGGEEKILKNAKDTSATEALEIATYTSLERLARVVGDIEPPSSRPRSAPTKRKCSTWS